MNARKDCTKFALAHGSFRYFLFTPTLRDHEVESSEVFFYLNDVPHYEKTPLL
jgi:hypothetical protein